MKGKLRRGTKRSEDINESTAQLNTYINYVKKKKPTERRQSQREREKERGSERREKKENCWHLAPRRDRTLPTCVQEQD